MASSFSLFVRFFILCATGAEPDFLCANFYDKGHGDGGGDGDGDGDGRQ